MQAPLALTLFFQITVDVIMMALQNRGLSTKWYDTRIHPSMLDLNNIKGFILNMPLTSPPDTRHWLVISKIGNIWYNLDSLRKEPEELGDDEDMVSSLEYVLQDANNQLLVVVAEAISLNESWLHKT